MSVIVFDSLEYAKRLEAAGFTREQAEIQAEMLYGIIKGQFSAKHDQKNLEAFLDGKLRALEFRICIWTGMITTVAVFLLAGLMR